MRGGRVALLGLPKDPVDLDLRRLTLFERSLVGASATGTTSRAFWCSWRTRASTLLPSSVRRSH